jgi:hypothetical protein
MRYSFTAGPSKGRLAIALPVAVLLVSAFFSRAAERQYVKVEYDLNVPASVRTIVDALIRGEVMKPDVSESELRRRREYVAERLGGTETDRACFYIVLGPPNEIESRPGRMESWIYQINRDAQLRVIFTREPQRLNISQGSNIKAEYDENAPTKVREIVEALVRGETQEEGVPQAELKTRRAYAITRFGGTQTDRARFYVALGPPEEIESYNPAPGWERWVYRSLGFKVIFSNLQ